VSCSDDRVVTLDLLTHLTLSKYKSLWDKVDATHDFFRNLLLSEVIPDFIYVEDAMMRFQPGRSSAATISTLLRFNALTTYVIRDVFKLNPEFISVNHARKQCGIKTQRVSKCGKSHKQQVFDYMIVNDLKMKQWPNKKRSSNIVDWAYDEVDSYVIAKAGLLDVVNSQS